jgi:predicted nucleotidyltransferase
MTTAELPPKEGLTHDAIDRATPELVRELRALCEADLFAVLLYGSAVGGGFKGARSNVNILVVLKTLEVKLLRKLAPLVDRWESQLFVLHVTTLANLQASADVLPGHLLELREHHRVLFGADPTEGIDVAREKLLWASERDLHELIRHLTRAIVRHGEARQGLAAAIRRNFRSFLYTLRTMLRYAARVPKTTDKHPTISAAAEVFGLDEPTLLDLLDFRRRSALPPEKELVDLAEGLLQQATKAAEKARDLSLSPSQEPS